MSDSNDTQQPAGPLPNGMTEAPYSANWQMYRKDGVKVQFTMRAHRPEDQGYLAGFVDFVHTAISDLTRAGYSATDPRMAAVEARQQATENGADPALGEEEEDADLYMVVQQTNQQKAIFFYIEQFGREKCIGKAYPERFGQLPWALDITNVKIWKQKTTPERPEAEEGGYMNKLPNKFRYVRRLRKSKTGGFDAKPFHRTIAVYNAAGLPIPWTPVGATEDYEDEPQPPPQAASSPQQAPQPAPAPPKTYRPNDDLWDDDNNQEPLDPNALAAAAAEKKAADQAIATARIAFHAAITKNIQPSLTGTDAAHVNDEAAAWLTQSWMKQKHEKPGVYDMNQLSLQDLTELTAALGTNVEKRRAAYDAHIEAKRTAEAAAAAS